MYTTNKSNGKKDGKENILTHIQNDINRRSELSEGGFKPILSSKYLVKRYEIMF